ncbi:hypothetical protein OIU92_02510 [Escherichia coli]|nr:hypothetical protein [Escherichia coli]
MKKLDDLPDYTVSRILIWMRRCNIALDLAKLEKPDPRNNPLLSSNINQAQEIVPDFLTAARCRKSDATKCKVVSSLVTYALSRLENSQRNPYDDGYRILRFVKLR